MVETSIGIRDLKAHLSHHLNNVKQGAVLVITEYGRPIGRIVPIQGNAHARTLDLISAGLAAWNGEKPVLSDSKPIVTGDRSLAELILEDRESTTTGFQPVACSCD